MTQESSREFNKISREYDVGRVSEDIQFWAKEAQKIAQLDQYSLVVDMGCGTGNYGMGMKIITKSTVVGFDPVPGMLKEAKIKDPNFFVIRAIAEQMPFRCNLLDLVYAAQVWHHVRGRSKAANECHRVLKHGGRKIAHTIGHNQLKNKVVFKFFPEIMMNQLNVYPSDEEFMSIFKEARFTKVEIYPFNIKRYQSVEELIEIAEKKLWSMFRPITEAGLEKGINELRKWSQEHNGELIRNDEMITLFVAQK